MIEEIDLDYGDDENSDKKLGLTTTNEVNSSGSNGSADFLDTLSIDLSADNNPPAPPTSANNSFSGSHEPLELEGEDELGAPVAEAPQESSGTYSMPEPAPDPVEEGLQLATVPIQTIAPIKKVADPLASNSGSHRAAMPLIKPRRDPAKSSVIKGVTISLLLIIAAVTVVVGGFKFGYTPFSPAEPIATNMPGIAIKSLYGEPLRLLGGQELFFVKGDLQLIDNTTLSGIEIEVAILDSKLQNVLIRDRVKPGTFYTPEELENVASNETVKAKIRKSRPTHFEAVFQAKQISDSLLAIRQNPDRLRITLIKK